MKITRYMVGAAVGFLCLVAPSAVRADGVVYSNFGSGDTFGALAWGVGGPQTILFQDIAGTFTGTGHSLAEVDLPLFYAAGANSVVVDLLGGSGGVPNTSNLVEQWTLNNLPTTPHIFDLASNSNPLLASGTQYWLAVFPGAPDTLVGWNENSTGVMGLAGSLDGGTSWTSFPDLPAPAFRILAVPEPSSSLFLGMGLVGLGALLRRFRRTT